LATLYLHVRTLHMHNYKQLTANQDTPNPKVSTCCQLILASSYLCKYIKNTKIFIKCFLSFLITRVTYLVLTQKWQ